jgi:hypothetical protein
MMSATDPPETPSLRELRRHVQAEYSPNHPFRLAIEALPDSVRAPEFQAQLRILLPLSRVKGDG